jgi:hypothetical protein
VEEKLATGSPTGQIDQKREKETHMKTIVLSTIAGVLFAFSQANADYVRGYVRRDGTYVAPHQRTSPDRNPYNNYNYPGNYNPNTSRTTPGNPDTYLERYYDRGHSSGGFGSSDLFNSRRR